MKYLLALLLLLPVFPAQAADPAFEAAMALYRQGADGDADANDKAYDALQALVTQDPANPLYRVYLGSTISMKARAAWMPWNKIGYAERGLDTMAKAVAMLAPEHDTQLDRGMPVSARVRSIAGIGFIRVPNMFGRFDEGRELLDGLLNDPLLTTVAAPGKAYIHFFAGEAAREEGEVDRARSLYQTTVELAPGSDYAARAQAALATLN